jgi:hypothetical protein
MTHEEIRSMCEVAKNLAVDVNDEELRPHAFSAILSALLNSSSRGTKSDVPSHVAQAKPGKPPRKAGLKARLIELVDANFFQSAKSVAEITSELKNAGWIHQPKEVSARLIELSRAKRLRRSSTTAGLLYSNW